MGKTSAWMRWGLPALGGLLTALSLQAQELVSSDAAGNPLIETGATESFYKLEDVTPDGRYALFSSRTCNVYRKDRVSGELLLVLENTLTDTGGYSWCNGAGISADGNLVAASPMQRVGEPELVSSGPDGAVLYSFGPVTEVLRKSVNDGLIVEISREFTTTSANDLARIELGNGCCYGALFNELSHDGATALIGDGSPLAFGGTGTTLPSAVARIRHRIADIESGTISPVTLAPDATDPPPVIVSAQLSRDGERLLLQTAALVEATNEQPQGPSDSTGLCDRLGSCRPPVICTPEGTASWWGCGFEPQQIRRELLVYELATGTAHSIYSLDPGSLLTLAATAISGDGSQAFFVLSPPLCLRGPFAPPCPELLSDADAAAVGLHRIAIDTADASFTSEILPSVCDGFDSAETDRCEQLSVADNGSRLLVGIRAGNAGVPFPGPLPLNSYLTEDYSGNEYNKDVGCVLIGGEPQPCILGAYTPAIYYAGPAYRWYLADTETGHSEMLSIFDGGLVQAGSAQLAGNGSTWAFSSTFDLDANTGEDLAWLPGGRVYTDSAGKTVDLAVVTRRLPPQPGATGARLKTIVSNYGDEAANFVAVDFMIRKPGAGVAGEPEVSLDYDGCDVYDNTSYNRNGYPLTTDGGQLEQQGNRYTLRCAIGLLGAGQRFTFYWQIDSPGNASLQIRSRVEGNEADSNLRNNRRWISVGGSR